MPTRTRHRNYCFTINNYTQEEIQRLDAAECTYLIYGREVGEQGTPHLQGYIEFSRPVDFDVVQAIAPRAHFEVRRGTAAQAAEYCRKDGNVVERGSISHQGKSQPLTDAIKLIEDGGSLEDVVNTYPAVFVRHERGLSKLIEARQVHRTEPPKVVWLFGRTGTGKTREACNVPSFYIKDCSHRWWDGYVQQRRIILDDYTPYTFDFRFLLRLLDRYPMSLEYKGGTVKINSPEIYITSDVHPDTMYYGRDWEQLARRITEIREMV